jgi:hypothetical protein
MGRKEGYTLNTTQQVQLFGESESRVYVPVMLVIVILDESGHVEKQVQEVQAESVATPTMEDFYQSHICFDPADWEDDGYQVVG